jgi:hypothetical protein
MRRVLSLLLPFALQTPAALAHHGVAAYDMGVVLTADGVVERWAWQNPHTALMLRVTRDGATQMFEIEGAPLRWMQGQGWTSESLAANEPVTITYHPTRRAEPGYAGILMEVQRASGEVLKVNRPASLGGP